MARQPTATTGKDSSIGALIARLERALRLFPLVNKFTIARNSRLPSLVNPQVSSEIQEMQFNGLVLASAFAALTACSGAGDNAGTDTSAVTPAAGATTAVAAGTAAPVTGAWHEVQMLGDEKGYRFEPTDLTIKAGDGVRWTMITGAPHNVQFQNVAADAKTQLSANMPNQLTDLSSPLLLNANEKYEMSFAGVKPGKYDYICTPHLANNMKGSITVQ
jgi:plastocyanin